jgi:dethiobiotin synthetase
MIPLDDNGYFVTGSDTDVGKTYIACEIVRQLRQRGVDIETRKPVESGCVLSAAGDLVTHDALALQQANGGRESIERIAAYRYRAAIAPHRAARLENQEIHIAQLIDACNRDHPEHRLIVEGAGGFYSPLAEDGLNADLASALQLPVIIVVNDRIGAINQALMTTEAVQNRHLQIAAIVLNEVEVRGDEAMDNAADLKAHCDLPLFACGHSSPLPILFG